MSDNQDENFGDQNQNVADQNESARLCELGRAVVDSEIKAIQDARVCVDERFAEACLHMLACKGRVVVLGMGKSGHIGGKIAATLASTGTPSFFVHPGEASHGDLGMIVASDVVMAISNSGETEELLTILPLIKRLGVPLITLTGNPKSTLAQAATVNLDVGVEQEACPLGLAPTSSTTVTLVIGDALAVALLEARGFTADDFARSHPGGRLGRRLLLLIRDVMHSGERIPKVAMTASLRDTLLEMTEKGLGITTVVDDGGRLLGVFTDGDLRRMLDARVDVHDSCIADVMVRNCKTVSGDMLAAEGLQIMERHKVNALPVLDRDGQLIGVLNMHDLLRAGVV